MFWWIWVLIGLLLLAVEFVATTAHIGLFAVGAFLVAILAAFGIAGPLWVQLVVFTASSLAALLFVRPVIVRKLGLGTSKQVDSMVGEQALAVGDIEVAGFGKAELRGTTWNAHNVGTTPLARGQRCTVERVEGLVLHLRS